ncbi:MAG: dynamin family protein [Lachnospira eligens]|jgi:GTP-binding protein EngB required for normal cell division
MPLFDIDENDETLDDLTESIQLENDNIYISDSKKAVQLISQLVHNGKKTKKVELLHISDELKKVFQLMNECDIPDMFEQQRKLEMLLERLMEFGISDILRGKHVVSLGGRFSAGKSKFINAITGIDNILPVDQNPTTSVPSYITQADFDKIQANTKFGYSVNLSNDAMKALSHEFYNKYQIGFSTILENIIIKSKTYNIDSSIVLLDTPGYSKMDIDDNIRERTSDRQKAHEKLSMTDYLIWLVDITKGTITKEDLDFIRSLHLSNKILVVFTKADKRTPNEIHKVINNARETIKNEGIDCYAVTAFSANENKEYFSNSIKEFLAQVVKNNKNNNDIIEQINLIADDIHKDILKEKQKTLKEKKKYFDILKNVKDITSVQSIARLWKYENIRLDKIEEASGEFDYLVKEIHSIISDEGDNIK